MTHNVMPIAFFETFSSIWTFSCRGVCGQFCQNRIKIEFEYIQVNAVYKFMNYGACWGKWLFIPL